MTASVDAPGNMGALTEFAQVGQLLERRLANYSTSTSKRPSADLAKRNMGKNRTMIGGRSLQRHGGITFNREFPEALRIRDTKDAMTVLDHAIDESRLEGGSLVSAVEASFERTKSLTAAVGWCAPSETIYDLCELETMDGMLDIPEVQATRGGFFVPENGGPSFATIYDSIGDEGDVILTEYDVENGADKVCVEIPCPDFVEVRLDVAYVCITGSLLQRRGYPEAVTRFSRGAMVALAHKVNESVIARMVAQSGSPSPSRQDASGDDAVSSLLSAVELAIEDMKLPAPHGPWRDHGGRPPRVGHRADAGRARPSGRRGRVQRLGRPDPGGLHHACAPCPGSSTTGRTPSRVRPTRPAARHPSPRSRRTWIPGLPGRYLGQAGARRGQPGHGLRQRAPDPEPVHGAVRGGRLQRHEDVRRVAPLPVPVDPSGVVGCCP